MTRTYSDAAFFGILGITAIIGAGLGILGTSLGILGGRVVSLTAAAADHYPNERLNITIVLRQTPDGCKADEPRQLRTKSGHKVSWSITNLCDAAYFVKVANFRPKKSDGSPTDPVGILEQEAQTPKAVDKNSAGAIPSVKVIHEPDDEVSFKYDILISPDGKTEPWPVARDPDIDIWP